MAPEDAWGHQCILEGQGIDLQRHTVDVNEVDAQCGCHADAARTQSRLHIPAARPGYKGDIALDGLHLKPLKVPLAAPPWVGGCGRLH